MVEIWFLEIDQNYLRLGSKLKRSVLFGFTWFSSISDGKFLYCLPFTSHVPVMQNWLGLVQNQEREAKITGSSHASCKQSERGMRFNYQVLNGHKQKKIALKWSSFPWVKIYRASLKINSMPQAVVPFFYFFSLRKLVRISTAFQTAVC